MMAKRKSKEQAKNPSKRRQVDDEEVREPDLPPVRVANPNANPSHREPEPDPLPHN